MANVWVLGGTSGLGKAMARRALDMGHNVAILGRRAAELEKEPPFDAKNVWRVQFDLRGSPAASLVIARAMHELPPDIVIWTSGVPQSKGYMEMTFEEMDRLLAVHLRGPFYLLRRIIDQAMKEGRRPLTLAVVSSTSSYRLRIDEEIYCAVTAAKSAFARQLARALHAAMIGSRVLLANVGGMNTPFWQGSKVDASQFLDPEMVAGTLWRRIDHPQMERLTFEEINLVRTKATPFYEIIEGAQTPEAPFAR